MTLNKSKNDKIMNILILGGAGFLGSNLVRKCLEDKKNKITVIDSLEPKLKSNLNNLSNILSQIKFIKGDIRGSRLMKRVVKDKEFIFNCAGQTSHLLSLKNPFLDVQVNCLGNLTLLEAVRLKNPKAIVVYPSSSTVIGRAKKKIVDESHSEFPLDIYSTHKATVEKYFFIYNKVHHLKTIVIRFANLYGPFGKASPEFGFINYFIGQALKDKKIPIFGGGGQQRNIMYAGDAVQLLYQAANHKHLIGNVFFAVHKEHYTVLQIAKEIINVFGKGAIEKQPWPTIRKDIEIGPIKISGSRLCKITGWQPKYSLKKGLLETKRIMEENE